MNPMFGPLPQLPPAPMPEEISAAVFGTTREERADPFLANIEPIPNPWLARTPDDTRLTFVSEESEEETLYDALRPIRKLFQPKQTDAATPTWNLAPPIQQDPDEETYFTALKPIQKLFHPDVTTITSASAPNLHKSDEWQAPLESEIEALLDRGDENTLEKRLKDSNGRAAVTAWIRKCIEDGDTVEGLMEFCATNDPAKAELIREIGATL